MSDWYCPHCNCEYDGTGNESLDVGVKDCEDCGESFRVIAEHETTYFTEEIVRPWPEDEKCNDAMERGDYLRDRAKDERDEQ